MAWLGAALIARPVYAQRPRRRIVILSSGANPDRPIFAAFRAELTALGHADGDAVTIDLQLASGSGDRLASLARAIVADPPAVVVADGGNAAAVMRAATADIPIVAIGGIDSTLRGLADTLARPAGNVTGITTYSVEVSVKQLELMTEMVPGARRVGVLGLQLPQQRSALDDVAVARHLSLAHLEARSLDEIRRSMSADVLAPLQGLVVLQNPALASIGAEIVAWANGRRCPAVFAEREYLAVGGLATYGVDFVAAYRRLAVYVDRVLRGARPADLPIERPERLELGINLRTARAIGLAIPPALLIRADTVVE